MSNKSNFIESAVGGQLPKFDDTDLAILAELKLDPFRTKALIAENVGIAANTLTDRINKLKEKGILVGFGANIDWSKIGYPVQATILCKPSDSQHDSAEKLRQISEGQHVIPVGTQVLTVEHFHGEHPFVIKVCAVDNDSLTNLISFLRKTAHLNTNTMLSLHQIKTDSAINSMDGVTRSKNAHDLGMRP